MPKMQLKPRKQAKQARSQAMMALILQAATRVLSDESLSGFTTNRVAERAGISIGSLYQYYPNKSALVAALIEHEQSALADAITTSVITSCGETLHVRLDALFEIAITHQFGNALYAAALDHEEKRLPIQSLLQEAQIRMVQALDSLLADHSDEFLYKLPHSAALDCLIITKALIESTSTNSPDAIDRLRARLQRAVLGYLKLTDARPITTKSNQ